MPITEDNTRLSIEFGYKFKNNIGDELLYSMKFTHSTDGPVVEISNGPYDPISFPAQMFLDVAEFLISRGVMDGIKPTPPAVQNTNSGKTLSSPLAIPHISRRKQLDPVQSISQDVMDDETAEEVGFENTNAEQLKITKDMMKERMNAKAKASVAKKPFHAAHTVKDS